MLSLVDGQKFCVSAVGQYPVFAYWWHEHGESVTLMHVIVQNFSNSVRSLYSSMWEEFDKIWRANVETIKQVIAPWPQLN